MSIISESLKEAYKLNEASLTPEEKMDAWHNGERRENIRACGDIKLKKYLEICKEKGYLEQAKIISDELKHRSALVGSKTLAGSEYVEIAKETKMTDEGKTSPDGHWHSLYSRPAMSYSSGFTYGYLFENDRKMSSLVNRALREHNAGLPPWSGRTIDYITVNKLWRCKEYSDLYLVSTPGFHFLTTADMLKKDCEEIEKTHAIPRDSSSSSSTSSTIAFKDPIIIMNSSGKPIFKTLDEKEAENFFMTHATAIRCSDPELLMQWQRKSLEKDATKGYLEARMAGDKLVLWPTDYICDLLNDLMGHRDAVLDFGYEAGDDKIIIPKTHKYANKVASAILKIIDKESKDYNV